MGKNNGNGNGTGSATQPTVHLVLQGKGGIGKSVVASWLTEFLTTRGQKVCAIDADPVNRSLGQYKALGAEKLDLMNQDGLIERSRFDRLVDRFATEDTTFVVDSGATAFLPFWTYIVEAEMIRVLREAGRSVYVHVPISGGEMLNDTLLGFKTLANGAAEKSLVLWINEYFGPVAREGKAFNQMQMQVYLENEAKVLASVGIPQRSPDTFGETIRRMRERKLTFQEALDSADFMLAQRSRLHIVRRDLFEQLANTPFA
jgi:NUBPL iron-transfer P-loop NTPase